MFLSVLLVYVVFVYQQFYVVEIEYCGGQQYEVDGYVDVNVGDVEDVVVEGVDYVQDWVGQ